MLKKAKSKKKEKSEVPISSMIDVVFLLLTFFIFTSKEVIEEAYVDLKPSGPAGPTSLSDIDDVNLNIEVAQDSYRLAGRDFSKEDLDKKIKRIAAAGAEKVNVTIMTRVDSEHERLVAFLDICKKHKVTNFNILSKK